MEDEPFFLTIHFEIQSTFKTQNIMTTSTTTRKIIPPLPAGLLGITLLFPSSYFILTLVARALFGAREMYVFIAPSFLQSPFPLFALHKAQVIIGCLVLAVGFNLPARQNRPHWL